MLSRWHVRRVLPRLGEHVGRRYAASAASRPRTLYDKIWDAHLVDGTSSDVAGGTGLLYIDRHLVHEVTSPQAFEGLQQSGRPVRRPDCTLVTVDHNIPTSSRKKFSTTAAFIEEEQSRQQVLALEANVETFGLPYFGMADKRQGIVHIIGPEQGFTVPGTTCVCGDSHTATHGAFGALAFGIGTSEVEHVLATSTLPQVKAQNMLVSIEGELGAGVTSKDVVLHVCGVIGTAGGTGATIEFAGSAIRSLTMEGRMSVCNMAIEAGARAGLIAPDATTVDYLRGRPMLPKEGSAEWAAATAYWQTLYSDAGAMYDREVHIDAADIAPTVTWGTSPQDTAPITGVVPDPAACDDPARRAGMERALTYMGLEGRVGEPLTSISVDKVFIGSCTNGRIEDIRAVAAVAKGRKVAEHVQAMVVPGSGMVREQAEEEGLDVVLTEAGFDWRMPGCSMCLAMNADKLKMHERCASTSNRNFEGRQGQGGRTHLVSPIMAAAAAISGHLADVRALQLSPTAVPPADATGAVGALHAQMYAEALESAGPIIREGAASEGGGIPVFDNLKGRAAPLDIQNIDTDMIIPKEYLKTIKRTGLGFAAFAELRYQNPNDVAKYGPEVAIEVDDFILNQPSYRESKILVAGDNFGCGSSREHAPWSINGFGIRSIIAASFADIFYNNCFKNGMLPVVLPRESVLALLDDANAGRDIEVDLPSQTVRRHDGTAYAFDVDPFRKHCLLNGLDDIGLTMQKMEAIRTFEAQRSLETPWLDGATTRVPKLFAVAEKDMPRVASPATPTPEDWQAEATRLRAATA